MPPAAFLALLAIAMLLLAVLRLELDFRRRRTSLGDSVAAQGRLPFAS